MTTAGPLDTVALRRALGNFATGITVITATSPAGERVGVTANSFNSVSLNPPLILWSIDKKSGSYPVFKAASHFAVNVLAADQMQLSNHFAKPAEDKFAGIEFEPGLGGAALFPDCAAVFQCRLYDCLEGGDHWILIGEVVDYTDVGRAPLVYHQGSYSQVIPFGRQSSSGSQMSLEDSIDSRMSNYLYFLMLHAVRSYQADYQPKQLATGLRTSEARILMSLESGRRLSSEELANEVNVPGHDMQNAFEVLQDKGLIAEANNVFTLEPAGAELASTLWRIAIDEQTEKFQQFSEQELATFRRVLLALIDKVP